jgi:hypothetical protein
MTCCKNHVPPGPWSDWCLKPHWHGCEPCCPDCPDYDWEMLMSPEIQEMIDAYKAERPEVDWDTDAVFVITDDQDKVVRIGHARKDRIMFQFNGQEIDR